jgi:hypothetical protein
MQEDDVQSYKLQVSIPKSQDSNSTSTNLESQNPKSSK